MPLAFRAMLRDGDKPKTGPTKKTLGVKGGNDRFDDIAPDANGNVHPGTGGMSVAPNWRNLPEHRIPKRLRHLYPRASGSDDYACWRMGTGAFESGPIAEKLNLAVDKPKHGMLQPAGVMTLAEFQAVLAATQDLWSLDEE
jgi:hypothetical protein